ncbi:Hint domain-containing protein [Paracoccus halophilus]|uniref:Hint domain-containing protein n=1 Tax=Paracoccus halophilus TaxID=376733 RepID=A0A1I0TRX3_9RHOB|nr:Hint domain-containing protein [Paracoccus halophilus]SFA54555.1 Hint domain-containing protein [Paracoccus halophilus]
MPDYTLEYVYANDDVSWTSAGDAVNPNNRVPAGTTFTLGGSELQAVITDDDNLLEDSVNAPNGQSLDRSQQVLASDMGANDAGDYVFARGSYEIQDELGNIGRIYQVRVAPWDYQGNVPGGTTQYWAFAGDIVVDPGMTYTVLGTPGSNGTIGLSPVANEDYSAYAQPRCFVAGTLIETAKGPVAVQDLKPGDLVRTRENGFKPVIWIESQKLDAALLAAMPHLCPIRIRAGAMGRDLPQRDLLVSPQHRMVVRNAIVARMFDQSEVLVAAKHLQHLDGIETVLPEEGVEYFHFLLDQHEVVYAEGAESETLYTGPESLKSLDPDARREVLALFPQLAVLDHDALPARAGYFAEGRRARRMAERAARNSVALLAS